MTQEVQIGTNAKPVANYRIAKLILGIIFDLIGMASYLIPGVAEGIDVVWAPLSGIILAMMYKGTVGKIGGIIEFAEEMFPFTDFIPTFTIVWIYEYLISNKYKKQ